MNTHTYQYNHDFWEVINLLWSTHLMKMMAEWIKTSSALLAYCFFSQENLVDSRWRVSFYEDTECLCRDHTHISLKNEPMTFYSTLNEYFIQASDLVLPCSREWRFSMLLLPYVMSSYQCAQQWGKSLPLSDVSLFLIMGNSGCPWALAMTCVFLIAVSVFLCFFSLLHMNECISLISTDSKEFMVAFIFQKWCGHDHRSIGKP